MKPTGPIKLASAAFAAALMLGGTMMARADTKPPVPDDEEPVGWPLAKRQNQEISTEQRRTPLPANTEVTTRALKSWPGQPGQDATTPAPDLKSVEIAPLARFTPAFQPKRFVYEGDEFALTLARAAELDKIGLRLRTSGETIEILAYAAPETNSDQGDAKLSTHEAVKLAFKRGMIVRLYLLDEGVRADQITLRALPAAIDALEAPTERVDIDIVKTGTTN